MIDGKKVLAVIPARGGSKGIPRKNVIDVAGKPLIAYTIEAAKQSKYIDHIHVSTDDLEIAAVSEQFGIAVERLRPKHLAADDTKTIDVLVDVVHFFKANDEPYDILLLLQPTQPLREAFHIDEALELYCANDEQSLVSVSPVSEHPILMRSIDEKGKLKSILAQSSTVRRQDLPNFYLVNGAIYINPFHEITEHVSLNDNVYPYIMESKYNLDIDEFEDLYKLAQLLEKREQSE